MARLIHDGNETTHTMQCFIAFGSNLGFLLISRIPRLRFICTLCFFFLTTLHVCFAWWWCFCLRFFLDVLAGLISSKKKKSF